MEKRTKDGVAYELRGSGKPLVVALHDWMGSRRNWDDAEPYLGSDRRWAFMDLRGYGGSADLREGRTFAQAADDVLAIADAEGAPTVSVVGHSMTGLVVQRLVLDAPARLDRVVGISPFAAGARMDPATVAFFGQAAGDGEVAAQLFDQVTGGRLGPGWREHKVARAAAETDADNLLHYLGQIGAVAGFAEELAAAAPAVPLLVLAGSHDLPLFRAAGYAETLLRWFAHARLETLPTGHFAMEEMPAATAGQLRAFLEAGAAP